MTRPPRPRAFRLDDRRIAVDDRPAPYAPEAIIQSQHDPIPPAVQPAPIDDAELKVEAAQKSGLIARSRLTLAGLVWTGLGGLVSLALGLWATDLIEGLFAKAESLGIIGRVRPRVPGRPPWRAAMREIIAVARQTRIAEIHVELAKKRARRRPRRGLRRPRRPACRALSQPAGASAREAEVEDAARAIIDGRDLHRRRRALALLRPRDLKAEAEIAAAAKRVSLVTAISPRAGILDVVFVVGQIVRPWSGASPRSMAAGRAFKALVGLGAPGSSLTSPSPGAWRSATACVRASWSAVVIAFAHLRGAHGRGRAQRHAHRARGPVRARRLPGRCPFRSTRLRPSPTSALSWLARGSEADPAREKRLG